ncbi:MAG: TIR domain-containing protein [Bacteriovoracaceae bacterium]|nr:TIR domain-containing protein [Bacteriovoracaceae bacterium]
MAKKKIFYSFHFDNDVWRVQTVRQIGTIEGNEPVTANKWEEVKKNGDKAIENWIDLEMKNKECVVVLVGTDTANRKWVKKEIEKAWNNNKGLVGIAINGLKDKDSKTCSLGPNPFDGFTIGDKKLSTIVKLHSPPLSYDSKEVYAWISDNISGWIDEAIKIRSKN